MSCPQILKAPALLALLLAACASPTRTVHPYPGKGDPQYDSTAYEASPGDLRPADEKDATVAATAAIIDTAWLGWKGSGATHPQGGMGIFGQCEMVHEDGSAFPCFSTLVFLKKGDGTPVSNQRTRANGNFFFPLNSEKENETYSVEIKSENFRAEFVPSTPLKVGSKVLIRLHLKK